MNGGVRVNKHRIRKRMTQRVVGALLMAVGFQMTLGGVYIHSAIGTVGGFAAIVVGLFISMYDEL